MSKGSPYILDRRLSTEPGDSASFPYDLVEENRVFEERAVAANMSVQGVKLNDWMTRIVSLEGGGGSGPVGDAVFFNTLTDVAATSIAADVDVIAVGGYATAGDCPLLTLKRVASEPSHYGKKQSADGAWWEYVLGASPVYLEWFGGKADYWTTPADFSGASTANPSKTDNLAAFVKADRCVAAFTGLINGVGRQFSAGPTIQFGYGGYYFSDEIVPTAGVCIQGMGNGYYHDGAGSRLYFAAGKKGIVINAASHLVQGANSTTVRNLYLESLGDAGQTSKHGIEMKATATVEHCSVRNFGGNGIHVAADVTGGTNANCFYLAHCVIYDNVGHGVYCVGGDANAGIGLAIQASSNGGYGINDSSFLGNTWVACHTAYNGDGSYYMVGGNSRSVCIGCYSEGGQPGGYFGPLAANFGGYMVGTSFAAGSTAIAENQMYSHKWQSDDASDDITVWNRRYANRVQQITGSDGSEYHLMWSEGFRGLHMQMNETGFWPYFIAAMDSLFTCGRTADVVDGGTFHLPMGLFLSGDIYGLGAQGRFLGYVDENVWPSLATGMVRPPGMYAAGDTLIRSTPGTTWGHVCTTAGGVARAWAAGGTYSPLSGVNPNLRYRVNSAGRYYRCITAGPGVAANEPVHTSGTVTEADGYAWKWLTNTAAVFKRLGPVMGEATLTGSDDPALNVVQTWDNAATTFRGFKQNITITNAATASLLMDLQVASTSRYNVGRYGNQTVTTGTLTSTEGSKPVLTGTQTWNDAGTTFKGIDLNITNTASAAASKMLDLRVGGTTKFNTDVDGDVAAAGVVTAKSATATPAGGAQAIGLGTTAALGIYYGSGAPTISAGKGSLYLRSDGSGVSDRMYVNTDAGTTWTAVTTAA
jgi:hypothetical protein